MTSFDRSQLPGFAVLLLMSCADSSTDAVGAFDPPHAPVHQVAEAEPALPTVPDPGYLCGQPEPGPGTVLDLGHAVSNGEVAGQTANRLLSLSNFQWILWDIDARTQVAAGSFPSTNDNPPAAMVGDVVLVPAPSGNMQLLRASDGQVLNRALTPARNWTTAGLASDASYVWGANLGVLTVVSLDGRVIARRTGVDWTGRVLAAPGALRLADVDTIVTLEVPSGEVRATTPYLGEFSQWFPDGKHFLTRAGSVLRVYTADALLVRTLNAKGPSFPSFPSERPRAGGYGNFVWTRAGQTVNVYRLDDGREVTSFRAGTTYLRDENIVASGGNVAFFERDNLVRLDLTGAAPEVEERSFFAMNLTSFVSDEAGAWSVADNGVLYSSMHMNHEGGPLPTGCGVQSSLSASPSGVFAIRTSDGRLRVFDVDAPSAGALLTVPHAGSRYSISDDGKRILLTATARAEPDEPTLFLIALPEGKVVHAFPQRAADGLSLQTFGLSHSGREVARVLCAGPGGRCAVHVTRDDGTPLYPAVPVVTPETYDVVWRPDGKSLALAPGPFALGRGGASLVIDDGAAPRVVPGLIHGWFDDARLLASQETPNNYRKAQIVGAADAPLDLPFTTTFADLTVIDATHVLRRSPLTVFRIPDGSVVWSSRPSTFHAAAAGDYVVSAQSGKIVAARWR